MKRKNVKSLAGDKTDCRRKLQDNFSCINTKRLGLVPRDFWKDLDPTSMELETECINRYDREEEYLNGLVRVNQNRSGCISQYDICDIKPFVSTREFYEYVRLFPIWNDFREEQIRAVGFCESCGKVATLKGFNIHHTRYYDFYDYFNPNSVMVLCNRCHKWIHGIL